MTAPGTRPRPRPPASAFRIERLLEHAAMYLIADLDSGEVAARIAADATITEDR